MSDQSPSAFSLPGSSLVAGRDINIITNRCNDTLLESDSERREILDWVFRIAAVNHYAIQSETYDKIVPDTTTWILREPKFEAWLSQEFGIFWGTGIPGSGKTVLTSFVINHLQERAAAHGTDAPVVFVYCRFYDSLNITKILAALLGQLSEKSTMALSYVKEKLYTPCVTKKIEPAANELAKNFLAAVKVNSSKVSIIIDALDELQDETREQLVHILNSLQLPIFLTSRTLSLSILNAPDICIRAPDEDLTNFITYKVRCLPKLWSLLRNRMDVLDEVVKVLLLKSDGMFLLAALQVSALGGITTVKSLRRSIDTLPANLMDMYHLTLERIMSQSEEEYTLACRAILWVTYAYPEYPLTLCEMLAASAVEPDSTELDPDALTTENTLLSVCCGLLTIEKQTGLVRLIHYTTYDFFLTYKAGIFQNPHEFAATICAVYMHLSPINQDPACSPQQLQQFGQLYPFIIYVSMFLSYHMCRLGTEADGEISRRVNDLLANSQGIPLIRIPEDIKPFLIPGPPSESLLGHPPIPRGITFHLRSVNFQLHKIDYGELIHFAALHGLLSIIKLIPRAFSEKTARKYTPLIYGCLEGHSLIVELLLGDTGVDVNATTDDGQTSLHVACSRGHEEVVRLLLRSPGIDVNARRCGYTALWAVARSGHDSIVKMLLAHGNIDPNAKSDSEFGDAAPHAVVIYDEEPNTRRLFIPPGITRKVYAQDKVGWTARYLASEVHAKSVGIPFLKFPGVRMNLHSFYGFTPLHCAAILGHTAVVQLLLSSPGIDVNAPPKHGFLAHNRQMVGYKVPECASEEMTALHYASEVGHESIVKLLLALPETNVGARDSKQKTALHYASKNGHDLIVGLLLSSPKIDVNARDESELTPLSYASEYGHGHVVRRLLNFPGIDTTFLSLSRNSLV